MKRDLTKKLIQWKDAKARKPLILRGARQVGKTYILKNFAQSFFENYVYVNFEETKDIKKLFETSLDPEKIVTDLSLYFDSKISPEKTLIIFDEVQDCPNALNSLKYFNEKAPHYPIIAAGSLLGVKLGKDRGFPVGKVQFFDLYPLSFSEFLLAIKKTKLHTYITNLSLTDSISELIHQELLELLKIYLIVGGMPEAVNTYCDTHDFTQVRQTQQDILDGYQSDFAKYASANEAVKISAIWQSIPAQLSRDNKKFFFKVAKQGARAREYENALNWLVNS